MKTSYLILLGASLATPVTAEVYVAPFGGYSFGASEFDISNQESNDNGKVKIAESGNYGVMLGMTTKDPGNIYLLYSHQATDLKVGGDFNPNLLTSLAVDYLHVGGSLYFPNNKLNPYVTGSVGLTQMRPGDDFSNETRLSMGLGGGIEYQASEAFSIFAEVKGYATLVNADNALFCDGSGCIWNIKSDIMWQGQLNLGASLKF